MKKSIILLLLLAFVILSSEAKSADKNTKKIYFKSSMDCANCEKTLYEYLKFEKGVTDLKVDHVSNTIFIEYKESKNSPEGFIKAIEKKGYKANGLTLEEYQKIIQKK